MLEDLLQGTVKVHIHLLAGGVAKDEDGIGCGVAAELVLGVGDDISERAAGDAGALDESGEVRGGLHGGLGGHGAMLDKMHSARNPWDVWIACGFSFTRVLLLCQYYPGKIFGLGRCRPWVWTLRKYFLAAVKCVEYVHVASSRKCEHAVSF